MIGRATDREALEAYGSRVRGSLLGGAIGDVLGGSVEIWDLDRIHRGCGREGVSAYIPDDVGGTRAYGWITEDAQLLPSTDGERDGRLITERWLYSCRAPGNTGLDAPEGRVVANEGCGHSAGRRATSAGPRRRDA